jgi:hypothetical protein
MGAPGLTRRSCCTPITTMPRLSRNTAVTCESRWLGPLCLHETAGTTVVDRFAFFWSDRLIALSRSLLIRCSNQELATSITSSTTPYAPLVNFRGLLRSFAQTAGWTLFRTFRISCEYPWPAGVLLAILSARNRIKQAKAVAMVA